MKRSQAKQKKNKTLWTIDQCFPLTRDFLKFTQNMTILHYTCTCTCTCRHVHIHVHVRIFGDFQYLLISRHRQDNWPVGGSQVLGRGRLIGKLLWLLTLDLTSSCRCCTTLSGCGHLSGRLWWRWFNRFDRFCHSWFLLWGLWSSCFRYLQHRHQNETHTCTYKKNSVTFTN